MNNRIKIRQAKPMDSETLLSLAKQCKPLDIHTSYTYWAMCNYHNDTIFIVEDNGEPIGYIMALNTRKAIFIWQIGIIQKYRRQKLAHELISIITQIAAREGKPIELSILEDNNASLRTFRSFCDNNGLMLQQIGDINIEDGREVIYQIDID